MSNSNRTRSTILNIYGSMIYQIISAVTNIFVRKVFLMYFSHDYLGLDGLFSNLINMLTLVDFGVGASCVYFIIKALAKDDEQEIADYYHIYNLVYKIIGIVIIGVGIILSLNLGLFVDSASLELYGYEFIRNIFFLTFMRSVSFYIFSCPKTTLMYAQKNYINMLVNIISTIIFSVVKIISIVVFRNYYVYLIVLFVEIILNYLLSYIIFYKLYPHMRKRRYNLKLLPEILNYSKKIALNGVSLFLFNSTDNIIISKILGLSVVGLMSNYYMIVNMISLLANQLFEAATASITNFINDKNNDNVEAIDGLLNNVNFIAFAVSLFCVTCLYSLTDSFIGIMYGWHLVLDKPIIIAMVINVFITVFQNPLSAYTNGRGLLGHEVKYTIIMAIVNIAISIGLAQHIGVLGVLIGTIVANLILLFGRFWIVYDGLNLNKWHYIKNISIYFMIIVFNIMLISFIFPSNASGFVSLIIRGIGSVILVGIEILLFKNTSEFKVMMGFVLSFLNVRRK